jgi:hypothetical protein
MGDFIRSARDYTAMLFGGGDKESNSPLFSKERSRR